MRRITVWDLPVRLFHWLLAVLIAAAWVTQEYVSMDWHMRVGWAILTLVLFRVAWGFVGSDTARFARFLRHPAEAVRHLAHLPRREPDREVGHNAAGGWMVLAMLVLIAVQCGSGLFANDDGDAEGPLMHLVDKDRSNWLSHIHSVNFKLIEVAVLLHILAVVAYAVLKRQNLVRPMLTGRKTMPGDIPAPRLVHPAWALVVLAAAAAAASWIWTR